MFNIGNLLKGLKIAEENKTIKSQISVSHWVWFCVGLLYLLRRWHWGQTSSWSLKVEVNLQGNECTCRRTAPYLTSCSHKSNETVQIPSHWCLRSRSRSARSLGHPCGCSGWTRKMKCSSWRRPGWTRRTTYQLFWCCAWPWQGGTNCCRLYQRAERPGM